MDTAAPLSASSIASAEALFLEAKDSFMQSMSDEEKARFSVCTSAKELVESMKTLSSDFDKDSFKKLTERIESFSKQLEPYFAILDIFVQINPQWSAIAWGSFRLVLKLASNYSSFFEELVSLLDEIKLYLPRFDDLMMLLTIDKPGAEDSEYRASQRLMLSIQSFYVDLFHLFQALSGVFTGKSSKIKAKHRAFQVVKICWQPFNVKFKSIISRLKVHQQIIHDEIEILNTARVIKVCRYSLEQLDLSEQNTVTLQGIQNEQDRLRKKIDQAFLKLKEAKDADNKLLHEMLQHRSVQVQAMMDLLSESEFESTRDNIRRFICAPEFEDDLAEAQAQREARTGLWLFKHPSLLRWIKEPSENLLWINGNPGSGKTVLAGAAVSELLTLNTSGDIVVAYFFFKRGHHGNIGSKAMKFSAYRALLAQIFKAASRNENLMTAFTYAMRASLQGTASSNDLRDLLHIALNCIPNLVIVVDAVDESEGPDEFVKEFARISRNTLSKILLFSRPNIGSLRDTVSEEYCISITESFNQDDIRLYCTNGINKLVETKLLPADIPPVAEMASWMVNGANGMFLWARLIFVFLESKFLAPPGRAPQERLKAIKKLRYPDSLDNMYARIIDLIWSSSPYARELSRQVFRWIMCEKSTILAHQLHDILEFSYDRSNVDSESIERSDRGGEESSTFSNMIILACSGLVEVRNAPGGVGAHYRFIHLSAVEFLSQRLQRVIPGPNCSAEAISYFSICKPEAEVMLMEDCLMYLRHGVPAGPLSGNMLQPAQRLAVQGAFPFVEYASLHWSSHLCSSLTSNCLHETYGNSAQTLLKSLSDFLSAKVALMSWVESLYLFGTNTLVRELSHCVGQWVIWATEHDLENIAGRHPATPLQELEEFMNDLTILDDAWGKSLLHAPEKIWEDVTAFTPSRFFLQTSATSVRQLHPGKALHHSLSNVCLCMVSEDLPDGREMAVLGIWPSSAFQKTWDQVSGPADLKHLYKEYDGWVARYQIWNVLDDEPQLNEEYAIPLEGSEVRSQIRHFVAETYHQSQPGEWFRSHWERRYVLGFPTAIKKSDFSTISILRTVYTISRKHQPAIGPVIPHYEAAVLPLNFDKALKSIWVRGSGSNHMAQFGYGVQFSECGKYVLYWDTNGSAHSLKVTRDAATTLAVFQIASLEREQNPSVRLLGLLRSSTGWDYFAGWSFHPQLEVLGIQIVTPRNRGPSPKVVLWKFDADDPKASSLEDIEYLHGVADQVHFSDCGTYIITKYIGSSRPRITSLEFSKLMVAARSSQSVSSVTSQQVTVVEKQLGPIQVAKSNLESNKMQVVQQQDGSVTSQRVLLKESGVAGIDLIEVDNDVEKRLPIVSLPGKAIERGSIRISIHAPRTREDKISILLHSAAHAWYTFSSPSCAKFNVPVVIKKDQRALPQPQKRKHGEICDGDDINHLQNRAKTIRFGGAHFNAAERRTNCSASTPFHGI